MAYFVKSPTFANAEDIRANADTFGASTTVVFETAGTFYFKIENPKIGEKFGALSDVTLLSFPENYGIIQDVTIINNVSLYQLFYHSGQNIQTPYYTLSLVSTFELKQDEVLQSRYPTYENNSLYGAATVTPGSTGQGATSEFYLAVSGIRGIFDEAYSVLGVDAPNDGRALVVRNNFTGERDQAWGQWLDNINLYGAGEDPARPVAEYVFDLPSDFDFTSSPQAPGAIGSTLYDIDVYGSWRALNVNVDPASPGLAGTLAEELWDQLGTLAVEAIADRLGAYGDAFKDIVDKVQSAEDLRGRLGDGHGNLLEHAFTGFDAVSGKNNMSHEEYDDLLTHKVDQFRESLREWMTDEHGFLGGLIFDAFADRPAGISEVNSFRALSFDKGAIIIGGEKRDSLIGSAGDDKFKLSAGGDALFGYDGNDTFIVDARFDHALIGGGRGFDKVLVASHVNTIASKGGVVTLDTADGTASIVGVERIETGNGILALDTGSGQNAGNAYRIYKAAFDREPDQQGLSFWTKWLDDGKTDPWNMAARFIDSQEFEELYGSRNPDNADYLLRVYRNVLDRDPDQGGYDWWLERLDNNTYSQSEVLARFSDSVENRENVMPKVEDGVFLSNEYFVF